MKNTCLVITSIASHHNLALKQFAREAVENNLKFIVMGDSKSPPNFILKDCDFYSLNQQKALPFKLANILPERNYARKNLGYLQAIASGASVIIETDDDNFPMHGFWNERTRNVHAHTLNDQGWVNIYRYFTNQNIWPRGFALEHLSDTIPTLEAAKNIDCPIQQGLANENPDVDAIFRLTRQLPLHFEKNENIAIGHHTWCPFNSQNTTWFEEVFPLLYLPSCCSFRMTDIWRGFVAQRIAWENNWFISFHEPTVWQERNVHNLMQDFQDELIGYLHNEKICHELENLDLKSGKDNFFDNLRTCYDKIIQLGFIDSNELHLLDSWIDDCEHFAKNQLSV